jgi:hypothetical protein
MTEYIKKKRGRKPKNKLPNNIVSNVVTNDNKSEDENIILHLPITINDINNIPNIKSYFIKPQENINNNINVKNTINNFTEINVKNTTSDTNNEKQSDIKDLNKNYLNINKILIHTIKITQDTKCWWCHYSFITH